MNTYEIINKLDTALVRTHAIIIEHKEVEEAKGKEVLWKALRASILEADNLMYELMKDIKHPDLKGWETRRGY